MTARPMVQLGGITFPSWDLHPCIADGRCGTQLVGAGTTCGGHDTAHERAK